MKKGYLLPESPGDAEIVCHRIFIPDRPEYNRAFWGALDFFGTWVAWERNPEKTGREAAHLWQLANELTNEHWDRPCNQPLPDEQIELTCECQEVCMCNFTFNVFCNGDVNGLPGNGGDDGGGNGGGGNGGPPGSGDIDGIVLVQPEGVLIEGLTNPPGVTVDTETVAQSWWIYADNYDAQARFDFEFPIPVQPGSYLGFILIVAADESTPGNLTRIESGGIVTDDYDIVALPRPLRLVGSNGASQLWEDEAARLVADEGYLAVPNVQVDPDAMRFTKSGTDDLNLDFNYVLSPWLVFTSLM